MKKVVLLVGLLLLSAVGMAQASRGDGNAAERATVSRKPAMAKPSTKPQSRGYLGGESNKSQGKQLEKVNRSIDNPGAKSKAKSKARKPNPNNVNRGGGSRG
jgi:hypothetical protein